MMELFRRIYYILNRRRLDAELADEMEFHREMAARHEGKPLGDPLRLREDAREAWGWMWIDRLGQDLRFAFRAMRTSPWFTVSSVLVLAIGIGATVAAFSLFNMVVLRPLPVTDPHSLLRFQRQGPQQFWSDVPYPAVSYYRENTRTLSAVLALTTARLAIEGTEFAPPTYFVTGNFFTELGATASAGRLFTIADEAQAAAPMVVLGHGFWASHFDASPDVVGSSVRLNGKRATVVGVAARGFSGLGSDAPAFWALIAHHPYFVDGSKMLTDFSGQQNSGVSMWGRLTRNVTPRAAEDELASLAATLRVQHPADVWEGERFPSEPGGYSQSVGSVSRGTGPAPSSHDRLYQMFALVGSLVLLILAVACGNLGSLLLARGASRQREIALRVAIGAGTSRLVRQLFTESLVLALMGALSGLLVGWAVVKSMLVLTDAPSWFDPTPDGRVVAFATGMGFLSATLFGLMPALHIARQRHRMTFARRFLIGAQVASSCVLLIVAGLLVRTFDRVTSLDPGFEYEHAIVVDPSLEEHGYSAPRAREYLDDLESRLRGIAGVEALARTSTPPLGGARITAIVQIDGRSQEVFIHQVDQGYLGTMRIPLRRGQDLVAGNERGVVISESLARKRWPNQDALGQPFQIGQEPPLTVVGIAGSARSLALQDPDPVELYRLAREGDLVGMSLVARTLGPPEAVAAAVSAAAKSVDRTFTPRVHLLKDQFQQHVRDVEQGALAVSLLGVIALIMASLGIVGLVSYAVAQQTKDIGIRMAIGAESRHILRSLAAQFQRTVALGLLAGVGGAAALSQLLRRELYGLSTFDPLSYVGAVALFVCVTGLAALVPARRALRVDPLVALRCD
ncbi:MAG: ABC transporter permease [Vicinamibacteria bacterium]|nr:ABC transporter permease [Vicinamibacteria bacterium]